MVQKCLEIGIGKSFSFEYGIMFLMEKFLFEENIYFSKIMQTQYSRDNIFMEIIEVGSHVIRH